MSQKEDRIQVARARFLKEFRGFLPEELERFYWQNAAGEAVDTVVIAFATALETTGVSSRAQWPVHLNQFQVFFVYRIKCLGRRSSQGVANHAETVRHS